MSITAEKLAEQALALPQDERADLAHRLIASLDDSVDPNAETEWNEVIDRRTREIEEGKVECRSEEEVIKEIRNELHAHRQAS